MLALRICIKIYGKKENDLQLNQLLNLFLKNQYFIKDNYVEKKLNEDIRKNSISTKNHQYIEKISNQQDLINKKDDEFKKVKKNLTMTSHHDRSTIIIRAGYNEQ